MLAALPTTVRRTPRIGIAAGSRFTNPAFQDSIAALKPPGQSDLVFGIEPDRNASSEESDVLCDQGLVHRTALRVELVEQFHEKSAVAALDLRALCGSEVAIDELSLMKRHPIKVVILTSTPIMEDDKLNGLLAVYNDFLRQLAKDRNLPLADLNAMCWEVLKKNPPAAGANARSDGAVS